MPLGILGKKLGMSQMFDERGTLIPVTIIAAGPCPILQTKSPERDGYTAVQLGFDPKPVPIDAIDDRSYPRIHALIRYGHIEIIGILDLAAGCNIR